MRKPGGRGPHLHLEVPAVGLLAHAEAVERVAPDRAERRHVGEAHAVAQRGSAGRRDARPGSAAGARLPGSRAPAQARAEHEVGAAPLDRREHGRDHLRPVAAVAVDEEHDGRAGRQRPRCPTAAPGRSRGARSTTTRAPAADARSTVRSREPPSTTITSPTPWASTAATHGADRRPPRRGRG